jgi:uncharacterized membrane protein YphA (DoxX/SURF4 family)
LRAAAPHREHVNANANARRVCVVTGVVFVLAGLPKLFAFHRELAIFIDLGLPRPGIWVIAAGLIEIAGGALLVSRRAVTPAAVLLGGTMAVAIAVSGIGHGDVVPSLTLAPALLAACIYLVVSDGAWLRRARSRSRPPR